MRKFIFNKLKNALENSLGKKQLGLSATLLALFSVFALSLSGCDGNASTHNKNTETTTQNSSTVNGTKSASTPVTATRYAYDCISLSENESPVTITNNCDFNVVFREMPEQEPVTILANSSQTYQHHENLFYYGACQAPYTPVPHGDKQYECQ